jgi:hypothetical protein
MGWHRSAPSALDATIRGSLHAGYFSLPKDRVLGLECRLTSLLPCLETALIVAGDQTSNGASKETIPPHPPSLPSTPFVPSVIDLPRNSPQSIGDRGFGGGGTWSRSVVRASPCTTRQGLRCHLNLADALRMATAKQAALPPGPKRRNSRTSSGIETRTAVGLLVGVVVPRSQVTHSLLAGKRTRIVQKGGGGGSYRSGGHAMGLRIVENWTADIPRMSRNAHPAPQPAPIRGPSPLLVHVRPRTSSYIYYACVTPRRSSKTTGETAGGRPSGIPKQNEHRPPPRS